LIANPATRSFSSERISSSLPELLGHLTGFAFGRMDPPICYTFKTRFFGNGSGIVNEIVKTPARQPGELSSSSLLGVKVGNVCFEKSDVFDTVLDESSLSCCFITNNSYYGI
jgi:hypothetical protein